jgi:rhamnosyltransferase
MVNNSSLLRKSSLMVNDYHREKNNLTVSIILLTYNGMPEVEECLAMVFRQEYHSSIEVVHIDSGSTDGTLDVAAAHGINTHHISKSEFHHSLTRNFAAGLSTNDILVFLTQDSIPSDNLWLKKLIEAFTDPAVGGVYGRQIPPERIGDLRRYALQYIYPFGREIRDLTNNRRISLSMFRFSNANCAVRADLCRRFKFNEMALVCEDHGMCRDILEAGFKIVYEPDAAVIHGHERTLLGEFKWAFYNGCSLKRMGILGRRGLKSEFEYGIARLKAEWEYFTAKGMYWMAFEGFIISGLRWFGVQIGKQEEKIPRWIMQRFFNDFE